MTKLYNRSDQKLTRQNLRKQEVSSEKLLWSRLRNKQQIYKFRRQHGIGKYIVDFYCPKLKLIIEIDGATHAIEREIKNDKIREDYLKKLGLVIKRYTNTEIKFYLDNVVEDIFEKCEELDPTLALPLVRGGKNKNL